jgi:hypothetical protein
MNGGAQAISPAANRLKQRATVLLAGAAGSNASDFERKPIVLPRVSKVLGPGGKPLLFPPVSHALCREIMERKGFSAVLTGTQVQEIDYPNPLEHILWGIAKKMGIPAVAVVDSHANELQRFSIIDLSAPSPRSSVTGPLAHLPDKIAVVDEYQRGVMLGLGFPADVLAVTGNPFFERVAEDFGRISPNARAQLLRKPVFSNFHPDGKVVVFMSDTTSGYPDLGFTEKSVLRSFLKALDRVAEMAGMKINLIIRPHPVRYADAKEASEYETPHLVKVVHNPKIAEGKKLENEYSEMELYRAADLVVGTFNNTLMTSRICGVATLAYLPGLNPKYDFQKILRDKGIITEVSGEARLAEALVQALAGELVQQPMEFVQGATDRVLALL